MSQLLDLPTETISAILQYLSFQTIIRLRLVSRRLSHVILGGDPLHRFKRFDSPQDFLDAVADISMRLITRVFKTSFYLKSWSRGALGDWVLARILQTRLRIANNESTTEAKFGASMDSMIVDGVIVEVDIRDRNQKDTVGVARVKLTAVENFGLEGGVRIHAKSSFVMQPLTPQQLSKKFSLWDPGYVTLLTKGNKSRPDSISSGSSVASTSSSGSPENRETRPLFPKSISRTGYFGDPGMRYIPCDNNLVFYLESVFNEGLKIEFLADCNIGFAPEYGGDNMQNGVVVVESWDTYSYNSPPHDISIERVQEETSGKASICVFGQERGEIPICLVGGTHGLEAKNCVMMTSSYLKMLVNRWTDLYS